MTDLDRRELARMAAWLLAGTAFAGAPVSAAISREIDAPGGMRLLHRLLGADLETALAGVRRLAGSSGKHRGRAELAATGRARIVADLSAGRFRLTVWSRRLGGVTIAGDSSAVRRIIARPRVRRAGAEPYDTAVESGGGVILTSSSTLAQRELPVRFVPGARLPGAYQQFGRLLLQRLRASDLRIRRASRDRPGSRIDA